MLWKAFADSLLPWVRLRAGKTDTMQIRVYSRKVNGADNDCVVVVAVVVVVVMFYQSRKEYCCPFWLACVDGMER